MKVLKTLFLIALLFFCEKNDSVQSILGPSGWLIYTHLGRFLSTKFTSPIITYVAFDGTCACSDVLSQGKLFSE